MPKNLKFFALKTIDTLVTPLEVTESDFTIGFNDLAENNSYPGSQGLAVILKKVGCKFRRFSEFFLTDFETLKLEDISYTFLFSGKLLM